MVSNGGSFGEGLLQTKGVQDYTLSLHEIDMIIGGHRALALSWSKESAAFLVVCKASTASVLYFSLGDSSNTQYPYILDFAIHAQGYTSQRKRHANSSI